ncbi:TetR/AcrR family transcriptional regulator C-terminal domain-containing protein [Actinocorallia longicatena]|uniref:TetR/AcrR family transcriptional regulator C-terminal domain-containing protein n=1 Tax=Actinocorallia longicatena TaxID=111803 RepID=A0ABP6PYK0_9ACTN
MLSRERIVLAAVTLVEREGEAALSMRAVAGELGVAVMSLYNHVPNKGALLSGIAQYVMAGLDLPDDENLDWKDRGRSLVHAFRGIAHEYPACMTIVTTHSVEFPVGMKAVERALAVADAAGFDGATSVRIMRALIAYALGAQLRELDMVKMLDYLPDAASSFAELDPVLYPHVTAYAKELTAHDPDSDFEFGLDLLISAIDGLPRR